MRETNPIRPGVGGTPTSEECKTKPIRPPDPGGTRLEGRARRGQMRETNPIRPGVGGTPTSEKCKTKPIGAGIGGQGSEVSDLTPAPWTFAPNKANFGGSRIAAKPFAGLELCPMSPTHRSGKTKPIWTGIRFQGSGVSDPTPDPQTFVRNEANSKGVSTQSQFPPAEISHYDTILLFGLPSPADRRTRRRGGPSSRPGSRSSHRRASSSGNKCTPTAIAIPVRDCFWRVLAGR
jgi:hypothetical protein